MDDRRIDWDALVTVDSGQTGHVTRDIVNDTYSSMVMMSPKPRQPSRVDLASEVESTSVAPHLRPECTMLPTHVISDTHFGHENILLPAYDGQFRTAWGVSTIAEMDQYLIDQWNAVVGPRDVVLHLGDLCFGERSEAARLRAQLHGRIILVIGNHDRSGTVLREAGFDLVVKRYVAEVPGIGMLVCRHDPAKFTADDVSLATLLVHGHCHARRVSSLVPEEIRKKCRCASVERLPGGAPMPLAHFLRHPSAMAEGLVAGDESPAG